MTKTKKKLLMFIGMDSLNLPRYTHPQIPGSQNPGTGIY